MWGPMKLFPFFIFCLFAFPAFAENHEHSHDKAADLMPAKKLVASVPVNAPSIHITMDKSEMVKLDRNAASVIVGNPTHASVLMDSPQLLVVVPRAPGATHFTVLDQSGAIILQRHVIVAAPKENYIRVRTASCGADNDDCSKTSNYYCEKDGMCHEIISQLEEERATQQNKEDDANEAIAGGLEQFLSENQPEEE